MKARDFSPLTPGAFRFGNWTNGTRATLSLISITFLLGVAGCSMLRSSGPEALQGTWSGREAGADPETPRTLVISGKQFEYRGANPNDWGKGTFTLRQDTQPKQLLVALTECGFPQYLGKTACIIYKLEGGTLTAAASAPGNPAPSNFDAPDARRMVFRKE